MIDINRDVRPIAAIFVIAGSVATFLAGDQAIVDNVLAGLAGVLVFATAALVFALGRAGWAGAALTLAGTAAAVVVVTGSATETPSAFYYCSVFVLGVSAAVLQYALDQPSPPLAALAAATPILAVLNHLGALLPLLGLAYCTGVLFDSFRHLWGHYSTTTDPHIPTIQDPHVTGEPVQESSPKEATEAAAQHPLPHSPQHAEHHGDRPEPYITIGVLPKLPRSTDMSPPRIEFSAPAGHQFDGFIQQDLTIRGASHVGTAHMQQRRIRQDAYAVGATNDGKFVFAAVADGVGSEPSSSLGADWSASSAVGIGIDSYDNHGRLLSAPDMVQFAADEVRRRAKAFGRGAIDTDFSTTLIVAVIGCGDSFCQLARVGDSAAFIRSGHKWMPVFAETSLAPDAPTNAIPADEPVVQIQEIEMVQGQCVLLVSDGIGDLLVHAPDVRQILFDALADPVSPHEFSAITGFQRRQAHDDQTALCIWRNRAIGMASLSPANEQTGDYASRTT